MFSDEISDYFEAVAAKYLSAVDARPDKSNQHEIGGLPRVGFKQYLGEPARGEKKTFQARLVYMTDSDESCSCDDTLTWYGATRRDPARALEYRLYYKSNPVTTLFDEGDFFLIAKRTDDTLLLVFCPPGSTVELQLRAVFGLDSVDGQFHSGKLDAASLILPVRLLLEELGLITGEQNIQANKWLELLLTKFGGQEFPATAAFSALARQTLPLDLSPLQEPDQALMAWMEHEELLFRTYERHIVQGRLRQGFGAHGDDVDEFVSYSLSVQNRRKSRVGHAFEGHLGALFSSNGLIFERPRGKGKVTENNSKPDFIFPDFARYHDPAFPEGQLIVLGAKTTCKDRWRQVLAEAKRVKRKHLVTLEPSISTAQTDEMAAADLQLVVPTMLHPTYSVNQQSWLQDLSGFIAEAKEKAPAN